MTILNTLKNLFLATKWNIFIPNCIQNLVHLILRSHSKDFSEIFHNDKELKVNKGHNSEYFGKTIFDSKMAPQCSGYDYCTTSFNKAWAPVLSRFKSCSQCAEDLWWWGSMTMFLAGNKALHVSSINNTSKTIHRHHHHHHHHVTLIFYTGPKNLYILFSESVKKFFEVLHNGRAL